MGQRSSVYSDRQVKLQQEAIDAEATREAKRTRPGASITDAQKKDTNLPYEGSEAQRWADMPKRPLNQKYDFELKRKATIKQMRNK